MSAPRILHIVQSVDFGMARIAADYAGTLAAAGHRVALACPPSPFASALEERGIVHLPWELDPEAEPTVGHAARQVREMVRLWTPDVVHLHGPRAGVSGRGALRGSVPTVFQPHGWSFEQASRAVAPVARAWERLASRWTHATVCVSFDERAQGIAAGISSNWYVIPDRVDPAAWPPADQASARTILGLPPDAPIAVCATLLSRKGGQDVLLRAWPAVRASVPDAELVLVSGGPERASLEAMGVEGVRFLEDMPGRGRWYAACDVVVAPSRWGLAVATLEAQASARTVVATEVGGVRESLGPSARVVPRADAAALATALSAALGDRADALCRGRQARAAVVEGPTLDDVLVELDVVYADAASRLDR